MAWSKEWPLSQQEQTTIIYEGPNLFPEINGVLLGIDFGKDDKTSTVIGKIKDDGTLSIKKILNNNMPTHDPYANPNAQIYYQCKCGNVLDPGTKSFAHLNNCASKEGWKIRFREIGYVPYCVKCGEGVE